MTGKRRFGITRKTMGLVFGACTAAIVLATTPAIAGGLYLSEVGSPSALGTASSGNVTNRNVADSAWTNPAGMTGIDGPVVVTLDRNWKDTYKVGIGLTRKLSNGKRLLFGAAYDSSPVDDVDRTMDLAVDEQIASDSFGSVRLSFCKSGYFRERFTDRP